jgi:hypothetical protein
MARHHVPQGRPPKVNFDPELPELRLLAQLMAVDPTALCFALNDPGNFERYLSSEDRMRLSQALLRLSEWQYRVSSVVDRVLGRLEEW